MESYTGTHNEFFSEVYRALIIQQSSLKSPVNLFQLRRVSEYTTIALETNVKKRFQRAVNKFKASVDFKNKASVFETHTLLRNPKLWLRSDVETATEEDWLFLENMEKKQHESTNPANLNNKFYYNQAQNAKLCDNKNMNEKIKLKVCASWASPLLNNMKEITTNYFPNNAKQH